MAAQLGDGAGSDVRLGRHGDLGRHEQHDAHDLVGRHSTAKLQRGVGGGAGRSFAGQDQHRLAERLGLRVRTRGQQTADQSWTSPTALEKRSWSRADHQTPPASANVQPARCLNGDVGGVAPKTGQRPAAGQSFLRVAATLYSALRHDLRFAYFAVCRSGREARIHLRDQALCQSALTHKSWINERHDADRTDNERLEFLGDAVLALVVSDLLMRQFPRPPRGRAVEDPRGDRQRGGPGPGRRGAGAGPVDLPRARRGAGGRPAEALDPGRRPRGPDRRRLPRRRLRGGAPRGRAAVRPAAGRRRDRGAGATSSRGCRRCRRRGCSSRRPTRVVGQQGPDHDKTFEVAIYLGGRRVRPGRGQIEEGSPAERGRAGAGDSRSTDAPQAPAKYALPPCRWSTRADPRRRAGACAGACRRRPPGAPRGRRHPRPAARPPARRLRRRHQRAARGGDGALRQPLTPSPPACSTARSPCWPATPTTPPSRRGHHLPRRGRVPRRAAPLGRCTYVASLRRGSLAPRLHHERHRLRSASAARSPIPSAGRRDLARKLIRAVGDPARSASARTACAPCAPSARRRSSGSTIDPPTAGRHPADAGRLSARSRPSASATSC